jgi:UDP-N-acetyl-D-glucosamine dehydrogenase
MSDTSITVIGLGYVGLPLALNLAKAGFDVTGFDLDSTKIQLLNSRKSYISDIAALEISKVFENHDFKASEIFAKSSTYIICVPTPLTDSVIIPLKDKEGNPKNIYLEKKCLENLQKAFIEGKTKELGTEKLGTKELGTKELGTEKLREEFIKKEKGPLVVYHSGLGGTWSF